MNAAAATAQGRTVLLAEDDRVMSDVIRFNLERAGFAVTVARNGTDAWRKLTESEFDLLITDYQMPGLSGEDVCRNFRSEFPQRDMPIIFLSARGLELNAARLIVELGIRNLLFKPFSPRELIDAAVRCVAPAPAGAEDAPETVAAAARSRTPVLV